MRTLRLVRNVAVLFAALTVLLGLRPESGVAGSGKGCVLKIGYNCSYTVPCKESKCVGTLCTDTGCNKIIRKFGAN